MSDASQGPGWWQASDGKWYPPEQAPGYQPAPNAAPGGTSVGDTLSYSWNKFIQNIGEWIVLWLILIAVGIVYLVITFAIAAGGAASTGFRFNFVGIFVGVLYGILHGIILVVIAKAAVQVVNGQKVDIGAAFKLTGNNIAAGVIFGLIYGLLASFCGLLGVVVWLFLGFLPVLSALDDKGADALGEATNLSSSHAGEAMLFFLVGWLITGCLCGLGAPISMIGGVYMAKKYRGEPVAP